MSINRIAVIGCGLMGGGIVQVAACAGQSVSMVDISQEYLDRAYQRIEQSLDRFIKKGTITESKEAILKRISRTTDLASGVQDTDFVIEAVDEDIELKQRLFSQANQHAPEHAIFGTNTTGLSISVIADASGRKDKVVGMHWMNPPQIMKLIELIKGNQTSAETLQTTIDLCHKYGKEVVVSQKDVWLFLAARAHAGWTNEALMMYQRKEAEFIELDAVVRYKIGLPMGAFELIDFTGGADIRKKGLKSVDKILKLNPQFEPWAEFLAVYKYITNDLLAPMSEKGLSGVKTGKGFYVYPEGKYVKPQIPEALSSKVEPIQLLAPAINTAAWCVTNDIGSISEINKSFVYAFSWPKGIFDYVDELGVKRIIEVLNAKREKAPSWLANYYRPDALLLGWQPGSYKR